MTERPSRTKVRARLLLTARPRSKRSAVAVRTSEQERTSNHGSKFSRNFLFARVRVRVANAVGANPVAAVAHLGPERHLHRDASAVDANAIARRSVFRSMRSRHENDLAPLGRPLADVQVFIEGVLVNGLRANDARRVHRDLQRGVPLRAEARGQRAAQGHRGDRSDQRAREHTQLVVSNGIR